ncbi:hypothetical protein PHJA_001774400 [Phtheirospermum japonicum]|uniref:Uncharacterized protein n=1 Tax=Phtheirospermum japonicum TaxID=374723 RepID=A0A830CKG2_9LAMI|nr:hypothetical protein PHJA_001774400 [Phtheirospermum japonicum]
MRPNNKFASRIPRDSKLNMSVVDFGCRAWRHPSHMLARSNRFNSNGFPCCSNRKNKEIETPQLLKIAGQWCHGTP